VMAAVLLAVAALLARDRGAPAVPAAPAVLAAANRAVRIDPATHQAVAAVAVGTDPGAVVAGGGLVWVANRRDGSVTVIDPDTNRVQQTIPASGSGPVGPGGPGLAFASGTLWVANTRQQRVARVDVEPDTPTTPIPVKGFPTTVVAAPDADAVWVALQTQRGGGLIRIDAGANRVTKTVPLPYPPTGLAITPDGGTVWVATSGDEAIRRVATGTGQVRRIPLEQAPDQVAFGNGAVWVTSTKTDAVLRIDPATSKVETSIRVGNRPSGIAFGTDRVWVANSQDGTVSTIDPQTNDVGTSRLGFRPAAVAVDQRGVWVVLA
jgi:YVTN family beta-propeller protein